jgi:hypothetical protein
MITGSKEKLDKIAANYQCSEHKQGLAVAWHTEQNTYVIRCASGEYPERVTRIPSLTEQYKQGEPLPEPLESNVKKAMVRREKSNAMSIDEALIDKYLGRDFVTGELIDKLMITALIDYTKRYGLDVQRGHVVVMYGKPYITLDGYLYHANRSGLKYKLESRPMKPSEYDDYKLSHDMHAWIATVKMIDGGGEFSGLGIVANTELTATSKKDSTKFAYPVVAAHPWQLAQKRAEWQALRRAFPMGEVNNDSNDG